MWLKFNARKAWGYRADSSITTHPIAGDVPNTQAADSIFDGITYAKGAAVLRQLLSLIGEELFSKALHRYFKSFEFSNATLKNFLSAIEAEVKNS